MSPTRAPPAISPPGWIWNPTLPRIRSKPPVSTVSPRSYDHHMSDAFTVLWTHDTCRALRTAGRVGERPPVAYSGVHQSLRWSGARAADEVYALHVNRCEVFVVSRMRIIRQANRSATNAPAPHRAPSRNGPLPDRSETTSAPRPAALSAAAPPVRAARPRIPPPQAQNPPSRLSHRPPEVLSYRKFGRDRACGSCLSGRARAHRTHGQSGACAPPWPASRPGATAVSSSGWPTWASTTHQAGSRARESLHHRSSSPRPASACATCWSREAAPLPAEDSHRTHSCHRSVSPNRSRASREVESCRKDLRLLGTVAVPEAAWCLRPPPPSGRR